MKIYPTALLIIFLTCLACSGGGLPLVANQVSDFRIIITEEGRMDAQSARGKVPAGVARRAGKKGKPVIAINGNQRIEKYGRNQANLQGCPVSYNRTGGRFPAENQVTTAY
jgi:hypothetical protein